MNEMNAMQWRWRDIISKFKLWRDWYPSLPCFLSGSVWGKLAATLWVAQWRGLWELMLPAQSQGGLKTLILTVLEKWILPKDMQIGLEEKPLQMELEVRPQSSGHSNCRPVRGSEPEDPTKFCQDSWTTETEIINVSCFKPVKFGGVVQQ